MQQTSEFGDLADTVKIVDGIWVLWDQLRVVREADSGVEVPWGCGLSKIQVLGIASGVCKHPKTCTGGIGRERQEDISKFLW